MPEKVTGRGKWWGCSLHSPKDPLSFRAHYASYLLPNLSFRLSSISLSHKAGQVGTSLLPPTQLSYFAKACTPTLCPASVSLRWDPGVWRPRLPEQGQGRTPLSAERHQGDCDCSCSWPVPVPRLLRARPCSACARVAARSLSSPALENQTKRDSFPWLKS